MPAARSARRCSRGTSCSRIRAHRPAWIGRRAATWARGSRRRTIRKFLDGVGAKYQRAASESRAASTRSSILLEQEKIVGWFQGRMEFGPARPRRAQHPRRSAVAEDAGDMNLKIKFRESFRPFAPIVLRDEAPQVVWDRPAAREPVHAARRARCSMSIACRSRTRSGRR